MAKAPAVAHLRDKFLAETVSARDLAIAVRQLAAVRSKPGEPSLHPEQARRIVELAFLSLVSAWDEFLEQTFVRYLAGAKSDSGYHPTLRLGKANSIAHSYHVVSGDPSFDPTRNYAKFSDPKWVISIAKVYFDHGSPYSPLMQANLEILQHAAKLRNRVAHNSTKSREEFKKSAKVHLGLAAEQPLRQGYSVGDLLLEPPTHLFGQEAKDRHHAYFIAYALRLRQMARQMCPAP